ncbi:hypothetical protein VFPPC_16609 [Pochonia chlamydosporia 170]|uniref:Uncharacterized protein n=1 Tax=Pochonia chlamydosporia 170 TaxID=1380566 RepID=A0A179F9H9_METCM|nr:hypothetical protein VFPPC_16609 [Pochonia chlamydosporia 170]OAQ62114.1 hypothetical protein VFPPC_16609 [Pochonia chlamydosporia 170]
MDPSAWPRCPESVVAKRHPILVYKAWCWPSKFVRFDKRRPRNKVSCLIQQKAMFQSTREFMIDPFLHNCWAMSLE